MTYRLSILDKSPIREGGSAAEAFATTLAYAERAERLGYHRFWLAEHHGSDLTAGPAPEVLAAAVLARTSRIRVGTGGVLLQHYSPFKVAELFGVLATLAPGRVDLGIGKAPGGLPSGTRALQVELASPRRPFAEKLAELDLFLRGPAPEGHALEGARALPQAPIALETFLLGSSEDSARLAASLGWGYAYAGHQDGDKAAIARSLSAFGNAGPRPILAVAAFAAPSREEAQRIAERRSYKAHFPDGHSVNVGSPEAVAEYARQWGAEPVRVEERQPKVLAGTAEDIHAALETLAHEHGIAEFVLDQPVAEPEARLRSIELIAQARKLAAA